MTSRAATLEDKDHQNWLLLGRLFRDAFPLFAGSLFYIFLFLTSTLGTYFIAVAQNTAQKLYDSTPVGNGRKKAVESHHINFMEGRAHYGQKNTDLRKWQDPVAGPWHVAKYLVGASGYKASDRAVE